MVFRCGKFSDWVMCHVVSFHSLSSLVGHLMNKYSLSAILCISEIKLAFVQLYRTSFLTHILSAFLLCSVRALCALNERVKNRGTSHQTWTYSLVQKISASRKTKFIYTSGAFISIYFALFDGNKYAHWISARLI